MWTAEFHKKKLKHTESMSGWSIDKLASQLFFDADKNQNKSISFEEMRIFFKAIHLQQSKKAMLELFTKCDTNNDKNIDLNEFKQLISDIFERKELYPLFQKYAGYKTNIMTNEQFQKFLHEDQNENAQWVQNLLSTNAQNIFANGISFVQFSSFLFSDENSIFKPDAVEVYQDMSRPLIDYYVNSSHNTYLTGHQLHGESSIQMYSQALLSGCRSVEIDLWDGSNGEPKVTHGYTLTSDITFVDVCKVIKRDGFKNSVFPIILSFEMHATKKQQLRAAEIMINTWGKENIYLLPENWEFSTNLPSPEYLSYKYIVKIKGSPHRALELLSTKEKIDQFFHVDVLEEEGKEYSFAEIIENVALHSLKVKNQFNKFISSSQTNCLKNEIIEDHTNFTELKSLKDMKIQTSKKESITDLNAVNEKHRLFSTTDKLNSNSMVGSNDVIKKTKNKYKPYKKIEDNLLKLVSMFGQKFQTGCLFTASSCTSINIKKFKSFCKEGDIYQMDYTKRHFLRVYPSPTMMDSQNPDPIKAWNIGAQLFALNFQTPDEPLLLNTGKFLENGGQFGGYILKPKFLLHDQPSQSLDTFDEMQYTLSFDLLAGQMLGEGNSSSINSIDPYIEIKVRGIHIDEEHNPPWKSYPIPGNGFNPIWSKSICNIKVYCPQLMIIMFYVRDHKNQSDSNILSRIAIPFNLIRSGIRSVPLLDKQLNELKYSKLLLKIEKKAN